MKSKHLQKLVLSKYEAEQTPKKVFEDLNGMVSYRTVKQWYKMTQETGTIDLSKLSACHRTVCKKAPIKKDQNKIKGRYKDFFQKIDTTGNGHAFLKCLENSQERS